MKKLSRREFLQRSAALGAAGMAGFALLDCSEKQKNLLADNWHVNGAFRLVQTGANSVELFCYDGKGGKISHEFTGLEADLLKAIASETPLENEINALAQKHHLTVSECRRQIEALLNEQQKARIIYSGDKMLVYKSEKNG